MLLATCALGLGSASRGPSAHRFCLPRDRTPWSREWPCVQRLRTPAGFAPLRRLKSWKPGFPGFASPSTFPSRRFSRPQGFASPTTLQPCFVLLPPLGFRLQSFSHSNSRDRLRPVPHLTLRLLSSDPILRPVTRLGFRAPCLRPARRWWLHHPTPVSSAANAAFWVLLRSSVRISHRGV